MDSTITEFLMKFIAYAKKFVAGQTNFNLLGLKEI